MTCVCLCACMPAGVFLGGGQRGVRAADSPRRVRPSAGACVRARLGRAGRSGGDHALDGRHVEWPTSCPYCVLLRRLRPIAQ